RSSRSDHSETAGSALKRPASSQCSGVGRTRSAMHRDALAFAPARFGSSTHAEQLSASFRSTKQNESCNAICITICLAKLARFLARTNRNRGLNPGEERFSRQFLSPVQTCSRTQLTSRENGKASFMKSKTSVTRNSINRSLLRNSFFLIGL